jgi:hypothetical protein
MKYIQIAMLVLFLAITVDGMAQNNQGKANDAERISLTPQVSDQDIPQAAKNMLMNKMKQIASLNGLSGDGESPFFVMDAKVDVLSKELTSTAPPMHALNLAINFFIADKLNNNVYSEVSIEAKGVGKNETKAYIAAIKNINTRKGAYKAFVERGKNKILEFYNSDCDFVISKAKALHQQGNNNEAIKVLKSVPKVSLECYDKCMEILATIDPSAVVDEPVAASTETVDGSAPVSGGTEVEVDKGVFLQFTGAKYLGNKLLVNLKIVNKADKDYELYDYAYDTRIIDNNGVEVKVDKVSAGGKEQTYTKVTVIPGVPVAMECEFFKVESIAMFEYKYKGRIFRLRNLTITE